MEKAGRGGDGAPRGPVLHIVVVGFHHKKGCQVRRGVRIRPRPFVRSRAAGALSAQLGLVLP